MALAATRPASLGPSSTPSAFGARAPCISRYPASVLHRLRLPNLPSQPAWGQAPQYAAGLREQHSTKSPAATSDSGVLEPSTAIPEFWVPTDADKEAARQHRRTVFSFLDWRKARSGYRYIHHFSTLFRSRIVRSIIPPALAVVAHTACVWLYTSMQVAALLPAWAPKLPIVAIEPFQLTSFALSLLLVFRTNTSYSRWLEGRKKFGAIITHSRDLARQAFAWFGRDDIANKQAMGRWLLAFSRATMCQLREDKDLRAELSGLLAPHEIAAVLASSHKPTFCLQVVTSVVSQSGVNADAAERIDCNVSHLLESLSACERILSTPIPLSYTRHTARFLLIWLLLLPFSLYPLCGWTMVPIAAILVFLLLGIEEIGVQIEEPFSILALEAMCGKLQSIVGALLTEHVTAAQLAGAALESAQPPAAARPAHLAV